MKKLNKLIDGCLQEKFLPTFLLFSVIGTIEVIFLMVIINIFLPEVRILPLYLIFMIFQMLLAALFAYGQTSGNKR